MTRLIDLVNGRAHRSVCRRPSVPIRKFLRRASWPVQSCRSASAVGRTRSRCCTLRTSRDGHRNRWRHTRTCRVAMTTERRRPRRRCVLTLSLRTIAAWSPSVTQQPTKTAFVSQFKKKHAANQTRVKLQVNVTVIGLVAYTIIIDVLTTSCLASIKDINITGVPLSFSVWSQLLMILQLYILFFFTKSSLVILLW